MDYDEEPVVYCPRCYSLKIGHEDVTDTDCCMDCGCTEVREADISTWEKLYIGRYGHRFTEKSNDPRKSPFFKMSLSSIKEELYKGRMLSYAMRELHIKPQHGLGKFDAVNQFIERLAQERRLDDLRYLLYDYYRIKG